MSEENDSRLASEYQQGLRERPVRSGLGEIDGWATQAQQQQPTLEARLLKAMAHVGRIEKGGTNTFHKYKYMTEEQVKAACQAACIHAEVMPAAVMVEVISDEWLEIAGKQQNLVKVRATIVFDVRGDDGKTFQGIGSSADKGDKAYMQAQTGAIREAWKNAFIIPSGSDPESNNPEDSQGGGQEAAKDSGGRVGARAKKEAKKSTEPPKEKGRTPVQRDRIMALIREKDLSRAEGSSLCIEMYGTAPPALTSKEAEAFITYLEALPSQERGGE